MKKNHLRTMLSSLGIICIVSIYSMWPLFGKGFIPTHDGEYHIIRFQQFFVMLSHGYWFPRWAPDLNSGYGIPVFNFNYPLPNYIGDLFHGLGLSFIDSFKVSLAFGYLIAILGCFFWLRTISRLRDATMATIIASVVPYWFVDIYVRGSIGEVWAITWVYWTLWAIETKQILFVGLAASLLILSHNILALIFFPVLILYALIRQRKMLIGLGMSVLLTAYFWIPAVFEQKYVLGLNTVNFRDHFPYFYQLLIPSWGTGLSGRSIIANQMSFQIGVIPLMILLASFFLVRNSVRQERYLYILFIVILTVSFFLMQDVSLPIWAHIPFLSYIQYPWRLLSVFIPATAVLSVLVVSRMRTIWAVILCVAAVLFSLFYMRPVVYAPRTDLHYLTSPNFIDGTSSMGNAFSTKWSVWQQVRPITKIQSENGLIHVQNAVMQPLLYEFTTASTVSSMLRVNTVYYPGWQVIIDGMSQKINYEQDGIIRFTVPSGAHSVQVFFGETNLREAANLLSIIGLFCLFISSILVPGYENRFKRKLHTRRS